MKRILLSVYMMLCAVLAWSQVSQQSREFERTYVSTDRVSYLAGERIWCSAFCFNASEPRPTLSEFSAVAYVELVADGKVAASGKIALEKGRGAGYIDLPVSMPTGNYMLLAYTALNKNEEEFDFRTQGRVVSVYNTLYDSRAGNVELSDEGTMKEVSKRKSPRTSISFTNTSDAPLTMSVSVFHRDSLPELPISGIEGARLTMPASAVYRNNVRPEYDGEVIYATVEGPDRDMVSSNRDFVTGYISTVGARNDTYTAFNGKDRTLEFATYNIYGNKDLVCEIDGMDTDLRAHMEISSPFIVPEGIDLPPLKLFPQMRNTLQQRRIAMLDWQKNHSDSLAEFLPRKEQMLLSNGECKRYDLNEYTRFPFVKDVLVEIIPELRSRGRGDKVRIEVLARDSGDGSVSGWKPSLVLLDGVPIFKHKMMMDYDAALLSAVEIWQSSYFFGGRTYSGAVNFVTSKGQIAYVDFGSNVRIVDFKGVSYPMEFTRPYREGVDLRQTILWKPCVELGAGESITFDLALPSYEGAFDVVYEGVDANGRLFRLHEEL